MNVEVESLPNCLAEMRIELPPERVRQEWDEVVQGFRRVARIPGFRPGRAPQPVIEAKFRKEIQEELTRKLVNETTRQAIKEKSLKVLSISEVEGVEFAPDKSLRFTATLITSPEFELPEYHGIPVQVPSVEVTDEAVGSALRNLQERQATFLDVTDRALQSTDFAVIDYETTVDGKPLLEAYPKAPKLLAGRSDFWVKADDDSMLQGFGEALVGMQPEERREFKLPVPEGFAVPELANVVLHFNVVLKAIKQMVLPELDDAFAEQIVPGSDLGKLREAVRARLEHEHVRQAENAKRQQVVDFLTSKVECELPQSYVKDETRRIMSEIVEQNQGRGVSEDVLRENQKDIISVAARNARDRLKANFILLRIADREGLQVTPADVNERIAAVAAQHRTSFEKAKAEFDDKGLLPQLREEILLGKVLDFLTSNASLQTGPRESTAS